MDVVFVNTDYDGVSLKVTFLAIGSGETYLETRLFHYGNIAFLLVWQVLMEVYKSFDSLDTICSFLNNGIMTEKFIIGNCPLCFQ